MPVVKAVFPLVGLIFFITVLIQPVAHGQADEGIVPNRILVKVDASLNAEWISYASAQNPRLLTDNAQQLTQLNQRYGVRTVRRVFRSSTRFEAAHRQFGLHRWYEISFDDTLSTEVQQVLSHYRSNPLVTLAEPVYLHSLRTSTKAAEGDSVSTSDPRFAEQWHYRNVRQLRGTAAADIRLSTAWSVTRGDARVIVAIIDEGIDTGHEDLRGALWVNKAERNGRHNVDDDGNGYIDDVHGYGFGDRRGRIAPSKHGTHVAGVVGATSNNGVGVAGVAGGSGRGDGVRLMSCAVFGVASQGGFAEAFVYAADQGAVIAQNSWGGGARSAVLEDAIRYFTERAGYDNSDEHFAKNQQVGPMSGGLVVFAAGNDRTENPQRAYPASLPNVLAVAATDHDDHLSEFSNYGSWVDLSAPGSDVLSTYPGNAYEVLSGTSMACPHVSGAAALLVAHYQQAGLTPDHLRTLLLNGADPLDNRNPRYAGKLGRGRLNAYRALTQDQIEPPGAVATLVAQAQAHDQVLLHWTASGADGKQGTAAYYDLRYATFPITAQNFALATAVPVGRPPRASGTPDTVAVTGLNSTTTYYFALRARDLLGQVSPLSAVVTATTLAPPVIAVQRTTLMVTLTVGQTHRDTIIVANTTGRSSLTFATATTHTESWLRFTDHSGTVAAGSEVPLLLTIDARRLAEGTYYDTLLIDSNDPATPKISIPIQATVVGIPQLELSSSSVRLEDVWISTPRSEALILRNVGTGTLRISAITVSGLGFAADASSLTLAPGARQSVKLTFSPTTLGIVAGTLTLLSNDAQQPRREVSLKATVVPTPPFALAPNRLALEVVRGDTLMQLLYLRSLSNDTFVWTLSVEDAPVGWRLTPTAGRLAPGDTAALQLSVDASVLNIGAYQPVISVRSESDTAVVPVALTVREKIAPLALAYALPDQRVVLLDSAYQLDLAFYAGSDFRKLRYAAMSEDTTLLRVAVDSSRLLLYPKQVGITTVAVDIRDASNQEVSTLFRVAIVPPNRIPEISRSPNTLLLASQETRTFTLATIFTDPDQDSLTYAVESSTSVVDVHLSGGALTVLGVGVGRAEVVVHATDPHGASVALTLKVEVTAVTATDDQTLLTTTLTVYPNPARDWLTVQYTLGQAGVVHLALLDGYGRVVHRWEEPFRAVGSYALSCQTTELPSGVYVLRLFVQRETVTRKIVVL